MLAEVLLVCVLAVPFIGLALRLRVLTLGGGLMAGGIAAAVVATQGWFWLLPLFLFLISAVLLGRLNKDGRTDAKHGKPRDAVQVFCNGGLYALLALADDLHADVWMTISICTATCDTWASEIGMYARWTTINIATLRPVPPGLSGGVSLAGTLGGLVGSVLICLVTFAFPLVEQGMVTGVITTLVGVTLAVASALFHSVFALFGMLVDSLLGALLQVKYDDGDGPSDTGYQQVAGLRWMTNDVVNLVSNALAVGAAWCLVG